MLHLLLKRLRGSILHHSPTKDCGSDQSLQDLWIQDNANVPWSLLGLSDSPCVSWHNHAYAIRGSDIHFKVLSMPNCWTEVELVYFQMPPAADEYGISKMNAYLLPIILTVQIVNEPANMLFVDGVQSKTDTERNVGNPKEIISVNFMTISGWDR